ncbi:MAG: hypothetical protein JO160_02905 [Candidatus Eremiobacteraeota bacterium]|nr:hypothetical protein [Candidatus Eremiobacteraeota bacterium]
MRYLALAAVLLAAAPAAPQSRYLVSWAMESKVFPGDGAGHDFIAVFDIGDPADFGHLVAMLPVETRSQMAHHTNSTMPSNHLLFANDFMADRSYVFDLNDPIKPRVSASFTDAGGYSHPHSFEYLPNGHVLATFQIKGADASGGLVELDSKGNVIRTSDATNVADPYVRPYSVLAIEAQDRVVTTTSPMTPLTTREPSHSVQVWRLSDLKLLKTVMLPEPKPYEVARDYTDDATLLSDGKTVLVKTSRCGLFALSDLAGPNPNAQFIYDYGGRGCDGVPFAIGNYYVQPTKTEHSIVALDVRDPLHPIEAGRLYLGPAALPHWLSREPGTNRFVITGYGSIRTSIHFATIDVETGALTLAPYSIDFNRKWPDGWDGAAIPHGTVFY